MPLLRQWGFRYQRQFNCPFQLGSQPYAGRVDFHVSDGKGPITLVEAKLRILNEKELYRAIAQAKSYALMLGLASFIVASPEGLWIYSLKRNQEYLEKKFLPSEMDVHRDETKNLLLRIRD